jgi:hypothetical protein
LSDGTEDYDLGEKLDHYRRIPSLAAISFVSHRERQIEVWTRGDGSWDHSTAGPGAKAAIAAIDCALGVDEIYGDLAI